MNLSGTNGIIPAELTNRFYCMRHGRSIANEAGLIISDPVTGSRDWGLASDAEKAVIESLRSSILGPATLVYTSPFSRTAETAALAVGHLGSPEAVVAGELRERWFGEWEGSSHANYQKVWEEDRVNTGETLRGVESPDTVLERMLPLLFRIEGQYSNRDILLVSHGDPVDILLTWASGEALTEHMNQGMVTAEIRLLTPMGASSDGNRKL